MSDAAPTDEALDGLSELAACDLRLAKRFCARIEALPEEDADDRANSLARSYQRVARSYRQSVAMQLRVRRELRAEAKADAREQALRPPDYDPSAPRSRYTPIDDMADLEEAAAERIRAEYDPSEAEAIEDDLCDLISEIWRTEGFDDLPLEEQVNALMAGIRKAYIFEPAPEPPPVETFNGRLAPPMDLPPWADEDSS